MGWSCGHAAAARAPHPAGPGVDAASAADAGRFGSAAVPAVPLPPGQEHTRAALLGVLIAAIVLITGGSGFYVGWTQRASTSSTGASAGADFSGSLPAGGTGSSSGTDSSGATDAGSSSPTPDVNSAPSTPTVDTETAALQQLATMRTDSLARVSLDGRWVAQMASKSVGITDPLQTAANGTHTFNASDILTESLAARQTVADPDSNVYVLWGTDFGKRSQAANGSPYWITLVDGGFSSSSAVTAWCRTTYSSLTSAQLADTCAPRQLARPHS
jgi:hypothetical protein